MLVSEFGPNSEVKEIWMLASACALHLPSIVVQLFRKYSKIRGFGQVPSLRFSPEGSKAKVLGGGKKSRVKEEQGRESARLSVSRVYQGLEKYRKLL